MLRAVPYYVWLVIFACGLALIPAESVAQMIDNPTFGNFEISTAGSVEEDLLNQISLSGRVSSEDFVALTRLIMLETYAMHQNVRADLRTSQIGANLQERSLALLSSASSFDAYVRDAPGTIPVDSEEMRSRLSEMLAEHRTIASSLGEMPGFSPGAARHLSALTQLLAVVNAVVAPAAGEAVGARSPTGRLMDDAELERVTRLAAAIVTELARMDLARENPPSQTTTNVGNDRTTLVRLVTTFQRLLVLRPPMTEVVDAWRVIRTRTWAFERRVGTEQAHPEWRTSWQTVRRRFDAVSDELQLPHVIITTSGPATVRPLDLKRLESVDLCFDSAAKYAERMSPPANRDRTDAGVLEDLRQLQTKLLLLRISTLASAPVTRESTIVRDLSAVGRSLRRRAQSRSFSGSTYTAGGDEAMRQLQRSLDRIREQIAS